MEADDYDAVHENAAYSGHDSSADDPHEARQEVRCNVPCLSLFFFFSSMFYIPFLLSLSLLFSIRWSSTAQFPLQSTGGESTTPNRFLLFAFATSIRSHLSAITNY